MINANLDNIKAFLETLTYNSTIIHKSPELPIDQLLVELDRDAKGRELFLLIRTASQDLCINDTLLGIQAPFRNYQELQLIVTLPFYVIDAQIPDIARFILLINKGMEIPGFELSEVDHMIFFRHAFVVPEDQLDERIFLSLIGMIEALVGTFAHMLESVATGNQSLMQIIEEVKDMIEQKNKPTVAH
ncbi:MAG: hypothetical protein H0W50_09390 [Parachlamydiaceae bacterium]|nr:hypothetical protein [Parachlamydiaceae bacterium]